MYFRAQTQWHGQRLRHTYVPLCSCCGRSLFPFTLHLAYHRCCLCLPTPPQQSFRLSSRLYATLSQSNCWESHYFHKIDRREPNVHPISYWFCCYNVDPRGCSTHAANQLSLGDPGRARCASVPVCGFVFWWFRGAIMAAFSQSFYQRSPCLLSETRKWIRCQRSRRVCEQGRRRCRTGRGSWRSLCDASAAKKSEIWF